MHVEHAEMVLKQLAARAGELDEHKAICADCGNQATFPGGRVEGSRAARSAGWHDHEELLNDCGVTCPACTAKWPGLHGFAS
ncbi:hypothetical protein [Streptomyces sp. NPDC015125]|uniref:hypothetical protein n=1 Tax=Streptomyces sp. NPDC015125 TaxID=3364938 RepID=UPI0036F71577